MKPGKLTNDDLSRLVIDKLGHADDTVLTGAGIGEDCCAVRLGKNTVVLSGDPITAAKSGAGTLAMYVTANDIAAAGAKPVCAIVTLLFPTDIEEYEITNLVEELTDTARSMGVAIGGGHTEITPAVVQTVINVTMMGEPIADQMISSAGAQVGDALVMSKSAAIEGTLILADDFPDRFAGKLDGFDYLQLDCLRPCLSVQKEGKTGAEQQVHAMHDVTEGGVIGAACEMARAASLGLELDIKSIPVLPVTQKLCAFCGIDPLRFVSSGSMLMATNEPDALISALHAQHVDACVIGRFVREGFVTTDPTTPIDPNVRDELYKLYGSMI